MKIGISVLLIFSLLAAGCTSQRINLPEQNYIAHAGGEIEGHVYTNSKEAVEHAIDCGLRYIELDLDLTSDGALVAVHHWAEFRQMANIGNTPFSADPLSKEEFTRAKIYEKYTPLTAEDMVAFLDEYPDIILVTDRISDPQILNPYFERFASRVIVECFSDSDYFNLEKLGYTCFRHGPPPFIGYSYFKKLFRRERYISKYTTPFDRWKFRKQFGFDIPSSGEMAVFPAANLDIADSLFAIYPRFSFIYVNNIER